MLSTASKATKIIVKAINASITDWLIVTIPKNDRDRVMLWATVKAVITFTRFINLVKVITAFTVAHSITLSLSFLGIVTISQSVIEALIALTIIFVALDAVDSKNKKFPWYYAFGFGLLHGFGFSGALSEIGINNNELALSLLFFNVGIEIAQLAIIPIPFLIIYFFNNNKVFQNIKYLIAMSIGGIGVYWFIDRVIGIFL